MDIDFSKNLKKYKITTLGFFIMLFGSSVDLIWGKSSTNVMFVFLNIFITFIGIGFTVFGYKSKSFLEEYFNENEGKDSEYLSFSFLGKLQRIAIILIGLVVTYSMYINNNGRHISPVIFTMFLLLAIVTLPIFFKSSENYGEFERNISLNVKSVAFAATIFIIASLLILFKIFPNFLIAAMLLFHNNIIDMMSYLLYADVMLAILIGELYTWLKYR